MKFPSPAARVITAFAAALVVGVGFDLHAARRNASAEAQSSPAPR
jgi:hypothetical protein